MKQCVKYFAIVSFMVFIGLALVSCSGDTNYPENTDYSENEEHSGKTDFSDGTDCFEETDTKQVTVNEEPKRSTQEEQEKQWKIWQNDSAKEMQQKRVEAGRNARDVMPEAATDELLSNIYAFTEKSMAQIANDNKGSNILYSPANLYLALSEFGGLASGKAAQEIQNVLGTADLQKNNEQLMSAIKWLEYSRHISERLFPAAWFSHEVNNSLWFDSDMKYDKEKTDSFADLHGTEIYEGDFDSREYQNQMYYWQYEKTNYAMTPDFEEAHEVLDKAAIASMNTIDFIDNYIWGFDAAQTDKGIFCDSNQHQIPCDFMNRVYVDSYSLITGDGYLAFSIMTQDYGKSFFILPNEDVSAVDLVNREGFISDFLEARQHTIPADGENIEGGRIIISLPKFSIKKKMDLTETAQNMGVNSVFVKGAGAFSDFSNAETYVGRFTQSIKLGVDEKGCNVTENVQTQMSGGSRGAYDAYVCFDRPFIYLELKDDMPYLMGIVENPLDCDTEDIPEVASGELNEDGNLLGNDDNAKSGLLAEDITDNDFLLNYYDFTANSLNNIRKHNEGENLIYSPLSFYLSLSEFCELSDEEAGKEIQQALGISDIENNTLKLAMLLSYVNTPGGLYEASPALSDPNSLHVKMPTLNINSSLWLDAETDYNEEMTDSLNKEYATDIYTGDCEDDVFQKSLAYWMQIKTDMQIIPREEEIQDILDKSAISSLNTIDYHEPWNCLFWKEPEQSVFYQADGDEISCDYLKKIYVGNKAFIEGDGYVSVGISMLEDSNMYVILPDENLTVDDLINRKDFLTDFIAARTGFESKIDETSNGGRISIYMPAFSHESKLDLKDASVSMGIEKIFDENGKAFAGFAGDEIYVNRYKQYAKVVIDNIGCNAKNDYNLHYTHSHDKKRVSGSLNEEVRLNRPFIYIMIKDELPYLVGIVENPVE